MTKKFFLSLLMLMVFTIFNPVQANNAKIYISEGSVYYDCPDGAMKAPDSLNIDIESVSIINDRFFKDKNFIYQAMASSLGQICIINKYENIDAETFEFLTSYYQKDKNNVYYTDNFKGWLNPQVLEDADVKTFTALSESYAKDKNRAYHTFLNTVTEMKNVDVATFEVLKEDVVYAMDKNNMYLYGKILSEGGEKITNESLYNNLKGKIILKVESNGEAYYIHPTKNEMHFLSRPVVAFHVMREQGVGITDSDLEKIEIAIDNLSGTDTDGDGLPDMVEDSLGTDKNSADSDGDGYSDKDELLNGYNPTNSDKLNLDKSFATSQAGKIFLQIEKNGEAWYVNPANNKRYFLGRPNDAFSVMRNLGLGISNGDFKTMKNISPNENYKKYTNNDLGFSVQIPENTTIKTESNDDYNRLVIFEYNNSDFEVRLKGWRNNNEFGKNTSLSEYHYLDLVSEKSSELGQQEAIIFEAESGYCDGPGCTNPFLAYSTKNYNVFYNLVFHGDTQLGPIEKNILDSFEFIN